MYQVAALACPQPFLSRYSLWVTFDNGLASSTAATRSQEFLQTVEIFVQDASRDNGRSLFFQTVTCSAHVLRHIQPEEKSSS